MSRHSLPQVVKKPLEKHLGNSYKVRLVADFSAAAFRKKQDKELALWYCLRALNTTGSGYICEETAIEGLCQVFGYSRRTAYRHLSLGEGVFWHRIATKRGCVIKIEGLKNVAVTFNTPLFNIVRFYEVKASKFHSLKMRRLAMWQSIHKPAGIKANPISRVSIEDYTGVQKRQQIRYDQEGRIKRTPCYRPHHEQKRLPNIYHNSQELGHKGMLPRVRRLLKSLLTDEALEGRRYFGSIRNMLKAKNRIDVCYVLVRSTKRQIQGRLEWEPIYSMAM